MIGGANSELGCNRSNRRNSGRRDSSSNIILFVVADTPKHRGPVHIDQDGELWTAGPGHFHGYYRKTMANRDSFRGRWFRTGDLMRREASGAYYIVGRIKDMIKRSGENIAAAEVEDCLCKLPGVVMAAVVAVPDAARGEEVKAYVQLRNGLTFEEIDPQTILAHCAEHLAGFKIPRYLAYAEVLPLTASADKVSKSQLVEGVENLTTGAYDCIGETWC